MNAETDDSNSSESGSALFQATGHHPGWVPVLDAPENRYHLEAFQKGEHADGTYEFVGPKVNGNKQALGDHELWLHGKDVVAVPRTFDGIRTWLENNLVEGVVFHHEDGRMCKIRRKDFKLKW